MIRACPEFSCRNCRVIATDNIDAALEGTDILYLTMAALREPSNAKAYHLAKEYGYICSDQLSVNGAFLALRMGNLILSLARKLEKVSPDAMMLIFPNPVSVYSCMVNTYTKINALGICGGFGNHKWDLSRLCGRNEFDPAWNVVAAGVNHCSFILRGEYKGEDLYTSLLPGILTDDWKCMDCSGCAAPQYLENALNDLYTMFRKTGTMIFSTEDDGLTHISKSNLNFCIDMELRGKDISDPEKLKQASLKSIKERFDAFAELSRHPEQVNWNVSYVEDPLIGTDKTDIFIPILKALDGKETMRIVASRPNRGAIAGLPENAAVEYSMDICGNTITPVENLYIPSPYKGLIAALAEFQTLQADAIAQQDPALFAAALDAYPVHQFEPERKDFFRKMFDAYDDLDPMWRKSLDYLF
jgi:alpha-galactosidase/6-phospho-beta-glucosidase family protein